VVLHVDAITWLVMLLPAAIVCVAAALLVIEQIMAPEGPDGGMTVIPPLLSAVLPLVGALCGFTIAVYFAQIRTIAAVNTAGRPAAEAAAAEVRKMRVDELLSPMTEDFAIVRATEGRRVEDVAARLNAMGIDRLIVLHPDGRFLRTLEREDLSLQVESRGEGTEAPKKVTYLTELEPGVWPGGVASPRTTLEGLADILLSTVSTPEVLVTDDGEQTGRVLGRISQRALLRRLIGR
jgi:CBS domain-containing protein